MTQMTVGLWYISAVLVFLFGWILTLKLKHSLLMVGILALTWMVEVLLMVVLGFPTEYETLAILGVVSCVLQIPLFIYLVRRWMHLDGSELWVLSTCYTYAVVVFNFIA